MKSLYTAIKTKLELILDEDENQVLKQVGVFNNQFERAEQQEQEPIFFPCAFVSFPEEIVWTNYGAGMQNADVLVRIYIGLETLENETMDIFDLKDKVFMALQGLKEDGFSQLVRVGEKTNEDWNGYYVFYQDYRTKVNDLLSYVGTQLVQAEEASSLDIIVDLDIDNNKIRTGDGA
jgi:hypothetical protein